MVGENDLVDAIPPRRRPWIPAADQPAAAGPAAVDDRGPRGVLQVQRGHHPAGCMPRGNYRGGSGRWPVALAARRRPGVVWDRRPVRLRVSPDRGRIDSWRPERTSTTTMRSWSWARLRSRARPWRARRPGGRAPRPGRLRRDDGAGEAGTRGRAAGTPRATSARRVLGPRRILADPGRRAGGRAAWSAARRDLEGGDCGARI